MYNVEITTLRRVFFYIARLDNQSFLVETIVLLYVYCFGFHIRFIGWIYMEMKYCDDGAYTSHAYIHKPLLLLLLFSVLLKNSKIL